MYLPHDLPQSFAGSGLRVSLEDLEYEALRIAGEFEGEENESFSAASLRRYTPRGRIILRDTELGNIGLGGVLVKSRRWFKTGQTYTSSNGEFEIDQRYSNKADIIVVFKNERVKIHLVQKN